MTNSIWIWELSTKLMYDPLLHIVLYQPEIPHNTGSVGRTCVALGAKLWLVRPLGFKLDDYYLRRAGLDYWEHLVWEVVDDWASLVEKLPQRRPWLFSKTGAKCYTSIEFEPQDVFIFGNESKGLPESIREPHADRILRVPTRPQVRCLNLANTVAIASFEAIRQWSAKGLPGPAP